MRGTYITAIVIATLIGLWLFSGQMGQDPMPDHPTLADANSRRAAAASDAEPVPVRARVIQASARVEEVVLRGKTENKRSLEVKAETSGRVIARPVERGTRVAAGQVLCTLAEDDRSANLEEARQALNQARIDYDGSLRLKERSLLSESSVAQARARVAAAEAQVTRRELEVERARIRAPFPAIVEDVRVEVGDFVTPGSVCVTLVDMDPMLLVGRVSERDVQALRLDQPATGILNDGRTVSGTLRFIGQQSDPATRTYAIEIELPNPDLALRSGITARIRIPTGTVMAQKVSPAIFALDDDGNIGVRIVNERSQVEYLPIRIVHDDVDGVWVTGLPEVANVITVGQELVVPGQTVRVTYESGGAMPAAAPATGAQPRNGDRDDAVETRDRAAPTTGANVGSSATALTPVVAAVGQP
ncbi:MAG: efflux RND transporter periplasmic adaptor subunit [Pseudomonadales bacterium]|nr:efflux RND transporter periplasmic adaptor subunit [Pseudomonadales bacterium]